MKPDHHSLPLRPRLRVDAEPERVAEQLNALTRAQERLQGLLDAVLTISRELELPEVLHQIVSTATDMVGARYGALAVVNERRTGLSEFITVGLTGQERADLAAVGQPQGRGLLGQLIHHTEPLRAVQVRSGAEQFQRLLLPRLPNLHPFTAAAIYRPATAPAHLGGDWYDAVLLPDSACAAVIGDVVGYNLESAAAMAQTRHMLRALLYDRRTPQCRPVPARPHPAGDHRQPPDHGVPGPHRARRSLLDAALEHRGSPPTPADHPRRPGRMSPRRARRTSGHRHRPAPPRPQPSPAGGLHRDLLHGRLGRTPPPVHRHGAARLSAAATAHAHLPVEDLCTVLADHHPSDGHDDLAILALRTPPR